MFKKKKPEVEGVEQTIQLGKSDVALVLRGDGRSETICTLKGKHTLTPQEEIIMALGGLLQQSTFVDGLREHFYTTMQNMLTSKMSDDIARD
jgi:hypothetical protein